MKSRMPVLEYPLIDKPESSFTLSAQCYLDPAVFEQEKREIFYKTWQYVAPLGRFPEVGDYLAFRICDESVFVIRSADGDLRAFYNVCRHRAHELVSGSGNKPKAIVCPYHAWSYKTDGDLVAAPSSEGRPEFNKSDFGLKEVRLESFCGCVFVNLDESATPLKELAGDMESDIRTRVPALDELEIYGSDMLGETHVNAGWKVVVDNFVECYHCTTAHPDFASLIDMAHYQVDTFDQWSRQLGPVIRNRNSAYNVGEEEEFQESAFWYLWPNTTFNIMPGSLELAVYAIRPDGKDACRFEGEVLTANPRPNQPRVEYTADVLTPEDISLCESVQRGLHSSSYVQGPFIVDDERSGTSEHGLHHFHRLVQGALDISGDDH
ncbi:MAG: Rieske 2Fe-2S domain-containing protein [Gammaproteobacteria bacterium]|nr:Rieske 2Fe-2S domain-containing protein [Gammaproteobacteria bacterium]